MNARELADWIEREPRIVLDQGRETILRALRLLAAAEANDGTTPETDAAFPLSVWPADFACDFARRLERERNGLAARVRELERDAERVRLGLALSLDPLVINSDNIGGIRRSLFLPVDCLWNAMVRELTAERENQPPRHRDDVQQEIDAARGSKP